MAIFTLEVILKMIGLGMKAFVKDRFNLFDTLVVFISILELLISDGSGATSSLRAFRLFRIFKIFRVGNLRVMLDSLSKTIQSIGNYVILIILFMYVFALMGMQFFAGKLKFDADGNPDLENGTDRRYNFNTIGVTFITIFQLLIGDNWNELMYDTMRSVSKLSAVYFVMITIIGTLVMVNLLIAIIISNFDSSRIYSTKVKMIDELKKYLEEGKISKLYIESKFKSVKLKVAPYSYKNQSNSLFSVKEVNREFENADEGFSKRKDSEAKSEKPLSNNSNYEESKKDDSSHFDLPANQQCGNAYDSEVKILAASTIKDEESKGNLLPHPFQESIDNNIYEDEPSVSRNNEIEMKPAQKFNFKEYFNSRSLLIFNAKWALRQYLLRLITPSEDIIPEHKEESFLKKQGLESIPQTHRYSKIKVINGKIITNKEAITYSKYFEFCVIILILLSSVILCIDTPLNNPDSSFVKVLVVIDFCFTFLFLIEAIFKIIALGFFYNQYDGITGYIMNWWNVLDFTVVVVSVVDFYFSMTSSGEDTSSLKSLKALRAIRALRPLRMISRNEGLKIAVKALFASIPAMANVLMVCLLFLLIFAILGVNFFKGTFYSCQSLTAAQLEQVETRQD